jgi:hypothetical protein
VLPHASAHASAWTRSSFFLSPERQCVNHCVSLRPIHPTYTLFLPENPNLRPLKMLMLWHPTLILNSPKPETPMYSLVIHAQADTCETCRGMHEILFVFTQFFVKLLVCSYFTEKHEKRWCSSDRITFSFSIKCSVSITVFHCVQLLPHTPFSMIYSFSCWVERLSTHVMSQCCLLRSANARSVNHNRRMNE